MGLIDLARAIGDGVHFAGRFAYRAAGATANYIRAESDKIWTSATLAVYGIPPGIDTPITEPESEYGMYKAPINWPIRAAISSTLWTANKVWDALDYASAPTAAQRDYAAERLFGRPPGAPDMAISDADLYNWAMQPPPGYTPGIAYSQPIQQQIQSMPHYMPMELFDESFLNTGGQIMASSPMYQTLPTLTPQEMGYAGGQMGAGMFHGGMGTTLSPMPMSGMMGQGMYPQLPAMQQPRGKIVTAVARIMPDGSVQPISMTAGRPAVYQRDVTAAKRLKRVLGKLGSMFPRRSSRGKR